MFAKVFHILHAKAATTTHFSFWPYHILCCAIDLYTVSEQISSWLHLVENCKFTELLFVPITISFLFPQGVNFITFGKSLLCCPHFSEILLRYQEQGGQLKTAPFVLFVLYYFIVFVLFVRTKHASFANKFLYCVSFQIAMETNIQNWCYKKELL